MAKKDSHHLVTHRFRPLRSFLALLAMSSAALPAAAQQGSLPDPFEIALPSERYVLRDLVSKLSGPEDGQAAQLSVLDAALARLSQPTKLRGFVQFLRADTLDTNEEYASAMAAISESVRLLPDHSAPLIAATNIYTFSNQPGLGADFLLRASQKDPESVRLIDDYEINALMGRLMLHRDRRRLGMLSDRLLEINWVGQDLGSSSALAEDAIKRRLENGDVTGARALVPRLVVPSHSRSLLTMNAYRRIWPDIEKWSGAKLERQWAIYLKEASNRWKASKGARASRDYVRALGMAGHDRILIRDLLPLFEKVDADEDFRMVFVVAPLAAALARENRWDEVEALFARAEKIWPLGSDANALNIAANRASHLLQAGRPGEALTKMNLAIGDASKWGTGVNRDALGAMHRNRACALFELGRGSEAGLSSGMAINVGPTSAAALHLCSGNMAAARHALLEGLKSETERESVIGFAQLSEDRPHAGPYARKIQARREALKKDPKLRSEIAKYGRVLPFRLADGAPPEVHGLD